MQYYKIIFHLCLVFSNLRSHSSSHRILQDRPDPVCCIAVGPAMPKIHVLHENPDWLPPLAAALDRTGADWDEWFLVERALDLSAPPPDGVFYKRLRARSEHRRVGKACGRTCSYPW